MEINYPFYRNKTAFQLIIKLLLHIFIFCIAVWPIYLPHHNEWHH